MKWTQTTPAAQLFAFGDLAYHLRIDADAQSTAEQNYVLSLLAAATEYAEESLFASLITRTITAVYYGAEPLDLPRGPVQGVTSVVDENDNAIAGYSLIRVGRNDRIEVPRYYRYWLRDWDTTVPIATLTAVYQAGFGDAVSNVPADILQAVRAHVGLMYERREAAGDRTLTDVPHSLAAFYARKSRQVGVG